MRESEVRKLAERHWEWLESMLYQQRLMERKLFIDAFVHGWKHAKEEEEERER